MKLRTPMATLKNMADHRDAGAESEIVRQLTALHRKLLRISLHTRTLINRNEIFKTRRGQAIQRHSTTDQCKLPPAVSYVLQGPGPDEISQRSSSPAFVSPFFLWEEPVQTTLDDISRAIEALAYVTSGGTAQSVSNTIATRLTVQKYLDLLKGAEVARLLDKLPIIHTMPAPIQLVTREDGRLDVRNTQTIEERCLNSALMMVESKFTRKPPIGLKTSTKAIDMIKTSMDKTLKITAVRYI